MRWLLVASVEITSVVSVVILLGGVLAFIAESAKIAASVLVHKALVYNINRYVSEKVW